MAKCPYCRKVLSDAWVKKAGSTLMGKTEGKSKSRSTKIARAAAIKRWTLHDELAAAKEENAKLRERLNKKKG